MNARTPKLPSRLATWTLSACAVHCVVTPFAAGLLPLVGLRVFASAWFEWSMLAVAASLGGAALGLSYARAHRNAKPAMMFVAGLAVLAAAHTLLSERSVLHACAAIAGALLMYLAGRLNHDCAKHGAHCA